jgi:hypothetical protein
MRREAARVAFFDRPDEVVAADLARLDRLLVEAHWRIAVTMPENPHCYTLRRSWACDEDFVFCVEVIRSIGEREKFPPGPGGRYYDVLHRCGPGGDTRKYWAMGFMGGGGPINYSDGRPCIFLINRKPPVCPEDRK